MEDFSATKMQLRLFAVFPVGLYIFIAEFTVGLFSLWSLGYLAIGAGIWLISKESKEVKALDDKVKEIGMIFFVLAWPLMLAIGRFAK